MRAENSTVVSQRCSGYWCGIICKLRILCRRGNARSNRIFSYYATDFYLTSHLRVVVIPILDLGSRKFIHYGVRVISFSQKDVMDIWDEALWGENIDTRQLTALSDRGTQMKGRRTKAHLIGKWDIRLEFA